MSSLAASYDAVGRKGDALAMEERALEFRRRVLPENHPDTGESIQMSGTRLHIVSQQWLFA